MEEARHGVRKKYTELFKRNLKKDLISYAPDLCTHLFTWPLHLDV